MNEVRMAVRKATEEDIERVHKLFLANPKLYQTAQILGVKVHMKPSKIRRIIRFMRLRGIGVQPTRGGYILSKFAQQKDDVHFLRMSYGMRIANYIALEAARPDIEKRWRTIEDKENLALMIKPIGTNLLQSKSMKLLSDYSNSLGV